jgi:hypothetical protein
MQKDYCAAAVCAAGAKTRASGTRLELAFLRPYPLGSFVFAPAMIRFKVAFVFTFA